MEEYFRVMVYKSIQKGKVLAECLELGELQGGDNVQEATRRTIANSVSLLMDALKNNYGPLGGIPDEEIRDLVKPGVDVPFQEIRENIEGRYDAVFRCYDKTNLPAPTNFNDS